MMISPLAELDRPWTHRGSDCQRPMTRRSCHLVAEFSSRRNSQAQSSVICWGLRLLITDGTYCWRYSIWPTLPTLWKSAYESLAQLAKLYAWSILLVDMSCVFSGLYLAACWFYEPATHEEQHEASSSPWFTPSRVPSRKKWDSSMLSCGSVSIWAPQTELSMCGMLWSFTNISDCIWRLQFEISLIAMHWLLLDEWVINQNRMSFHNGKLSSFINLYRKRTVRVTRVPKHNNKP